MATFFSGKTGRGIALAIGLLAIVALGPVAVFILIWLVTLACLAEIGSFIAYDKDILWRRWNDPTVVTVVIQGGIVVAGAVAASAVVGSYGLWLTMVIVAAVFIENAVAQVAGKRFGRTKLAPRYSPNKTVEGALWGWLGGSIAGAIALGLAWWLGGAGDQITTNWKQWLVVIVIAPPFAEVGDWLESRTKRLVGVKDSGELTRDDDSQLVRVVSLSSVWGRQGGALDKTDSLWFVMVSSFIVLATFWQIGLTLAMSVIAAVVYVRMTAPPHHPPR